MEPSPRAYSFPTLNELANVQEILRRLSALAAAGRLRNVSDVIVIDGGSTDGTQELVREAGSAVGAFRLTLVEHPSNLGPVEAQLSVLPLVKSDFVIFMDADLQHPVELIPQLVAPALGGADLVVASRYADGGGSQWEALRGVISRIAMGVAYVLVPESRRLTDPLSGYFGARVALLAGPLPPGRTYKLLLYLISGQAAGGIVTQRGAVCDGPPQRRGLEVG